MNHRDQIVARRTQADRRAVSGHGLVRAVVAIVSKCGVSAATFEAIGAEAGYSRSLVTQRFGSKRALIDAVIEHASNSFNTEGRPESIDAVSGLEGLLLMLDEYFNRLATSEELRTYFMLLSSAVAEANELRSAFAAEHERVKVLLAALVEKGQTDGSIRPTLDGEAAALMIGSLQLGVSMQLLIDPMMDLEPVRRLALDTVRLSLSAR